MKCLILTIYMITFAVVARRIYIWSVDDHRRHDDELWVAIIAGALWPAWVPAVATARAVGWLARHTIGRETPGQRRARLARDAVAADQVARELGLPGVPPEIAP